jgi:hypothetical protein
VVQHWTGLAFEPGPVRDATPRSATRHIEPIAAGADPAVAIDRAVGELRERARTPGVHSTALAIDPRQWELAHFTLWEHRAPQSAGTRYQVLHLSSPHLNDLEVGRHW